MDIAYEIERLINFALKKQLIQPDDIIYTRNSLLDLLQVSKPYKNLQKTNNESLDTATYILCNILDYCFDNGLICENTVTYRDLMDAKIMGILTPRPSEINAKFYTLYANSKKQATNYFYKISQDSNYIRVDRINKNLYWTTNTEYGDLEISINLSKPEKDPKDIAAAKLVPQLGYPNCLLCKENQGFSGNINHPPRQNLRLIKIELDNQDWYMQYSPYIYYNEHCIILNKEHIPMKIAESTFKRLLDFVEFLPHYFIGSNADIPIVGGSILTHDHYQGGNHKFAMEKAAIYAEYKHKEFSDVNISLVKWPLSVIRISAKNKEQLIHMAVLIMNFWKSYFDEKIEIIAYTDDISHNAITPIARINDQRLFEFDIVLRNNRTSKEHPLGIFHPHADLHHIKKENIGLIEVMGLAILPGRLLKEIDMIKKIITGQQFFIQEEINNLEHELYKFSNWIKYIIEEYGISNNEKDAEIILQKEIGIIFKKVLEDAGVFKYNQKGIKHFDIFMKKMGCITIDDLFNV